MTPTLDQCRELERLYPLSWKSKRRLGYLQLHGGKCVLCSSVDKLQFDHIDRTTKSFNIQWGMNRIALEAELKKCQILCADCHLKKTSAEMSEHWIKFHGDKHGGRGAYRRGCRCEICRAGQSVKHKEWRRLNPSYDRERYWKNPEVFRERKRKAHNAKLAAALIAAGGG